MQLGFSFGYFRLFFSQYDLIYWIGTVGAGRLLELLKRINDFQSLICSDSEIPFSDPKSGVFSCTPSHKCPDNSQISAVI